MKKITTLFLLSLLSLAANLRAAESEVAQFVPGNTGVLIQVNNLGKLWSQYSDDPTVNYIREQINAQQTPAIWPILQTALGLSGQQIVDTYFGQCVAVITSEPGDKKPSMIFSRVEPAAFDNAIMRLQLHPLNKLGDFDVYTEANCRIAYHKPWMAFSGMENIDYYEKVLTQASRGESLARDANFKKYVDALPAQFTALVYSHQTAPLVESHALVLQENGKKLTLQYRGSNAGLANLLAITNTGKPLEAIPTPANAVASLAMNVQVKGPADTRMIDRFIAPKTFANDVMPKIGSTFALTIHALPGNQVGMDEQVIYPVMSLAMKLNDASLSPDIDRIFSSITLIASLKAMEWNLPAILTSANSHKDVTYSSANFGSVLAQRSDRPELAPMNLAYGHIGNWYVLSNNNALFNQYIDAAAAPAANVDAAQNGAMKFAVLKVNAAGLSAQLKSWLNYWQTKRPQILEVASTQPLSPEGKFVKGVKFLSGMLEHFDRAELQLSRADDQGLQAQLDVTRR